MSNDLICCKKFLIDETRVVEMYYENSGIRFWTSRGPKPPPAAPLGSNHTDEDGSKMLIKTGEPDQWEEAIIDNVN